MPQPRRGHKTKPVNKRGKKPRREVTTPLRLLGGLGKGPTTKVTASHPKKDVSTSRPPKSEADKAELAISQAKGGGNQAGLLTSDDPRELMRNLLDTQRAIAQGWNIKQKEMIRNRLYKIMEKQEAEVMTKEGLVDSETKADELALLAAKVLTMMDANDVKRIEVIDGIVNKPSAPQPHGTNPNGSSPGITATEEGRSALTELALRFGARELVIDDRAVISEHRPETVDDVSGDETGDSEGWAGDNS